MEAKFDLYRYPRNFFINITGNCNLKCIYCSSADFNNKGDMTKEQLEHILCELKSHGALKVVITGGEPTLHKDFIWIITEFTKYFSVTVNTNGTNLSRYIAFFEKFEYKNRINFNVSMDSLDEKKNSITRGSYDLEGILCNTQKFCDMGYRVSILCTVTSLLDKNDLNLFSQFVTKHPNIGISLNDLKVTGRASEKEKKLLPSLEMIKMINEEFGNFQNFNYKCQDNDDKDNMAFMLTCGAGKECLSISDSGDVFPCTAINIKIGNIFENTIKEICNTSDVIKELNAMREKKIDNIKECKECKYKSLCHGGCRANAYIATGDLYGVDPYCWYNGSYFANN